MDSRQPEVRSPDTTGWAYIEWFLLIHFSADGNVGQIKNKRILSIERGDADAFRHFSAQVWDKNPTFTLDWFAADGQERHAEIVLIKSQSQVDLAGDKPWKNPGGTRPSPGLLLSGTPVSKENATFALHKMGSGWSMEITFRQTFRLDN